MTYNETKNSTGRWPSSRWILLVPVLLLAGALSAVLSVANPPAGFADIRTGLSAPRLVTESPVYNPPEFDDYHIEEYHEMDYGAGEIE